jgi:hypothetical protein
VKNIFIDTPRNDKEDKRAEDDQVMSQKSVDEQDKQYETNDRVQQMLARTHLTASKMERCVFAPVVNKRHKRQHQNGGSHESRLFQCSKSCQPVPLIVIGRTLFRIALKANTLTNCFPLEYSRNVPISRGGQPTNDSVRAEPNAPG